MIKKIKKHLETNQVSYPQHFIFAIKAGVLLVYAGITSLIHAINPAWFDGTPAKIVARLYKGRIENHPNPDYRNF